MFQSDSPDWIALNDNAGSSDVANTHFRQMSKFGSGSKTSSFKTQAPPPAHSCTPSHSLLLQSDPMSKPEGLLADSAVLFGSCGRRKAAIPPPAHSQQAPASNHLSQECFRPAGHGQCHSFKDQEGWSMSQGELKPWVKVSFSLDEEYKPIRDSRRAVRSEKSTLGVDQDTQKDAEMLSSQTSPAGHLDENDNLHQSPAQDQYNSEPEHTPSVPSTPESTLDWLGVEDSQDLFSDDGSLSPELPSREFYLDEEEKIQKLLEKIEQERQDHSLALRISKGVDPFSDRSLRSRGKTSETNTSS